VMLIVFHSLQKHGSLRARWRRASRLRMFSVIRF
jgi:hypothetical protein